MTKEKISHGLIHKIPGDVRDTITSLPKVYAVWEDITPLARNEWICWIDSAKKIETRKRRMDIMLDKFKNGERRSCCWAGCMHRS